MAKSCRRAFAGAAVVKCPLTLDYGFYALSLDELSPDSVPVGGTNIGDAIRKVMSDVFAVQEEMAQEITSSLRIRVSGEDLERMWERSTEDPEAYRAYLKGRYHWNKRTAAGVRRATEFFQQAIEFVRQIPPGEVTSYGQIATLITGSVRGARAVGYALAALSEEEAQSVPWWRVLNAQGRISNSHAHRGASRQRELLEAEGVQFDDTERVDFSRYGWDGPPGHFL